MPEQIAVLSSGVWELRNVVAEVTGYEPVRWLPPFSRPAFGCVVGWGLKPTSRKARRLARQERQELHRHGGWISALHPSRTR